MLLPYAGNTVADFKSSRPTISQVRAVNTIILLLPIKSEQLQSCIIFHIRQPPNKRPATATEKEQTRQQPDVAYSYHLLNHILVLLLCFSVQIRPGQPADNVIILRIGFSTEDTDNHTSICEILCLWIGYVEIITINDRCVDVNCVRLKDKLLKKNWLKLSFCLWSPMFFTSVKMWYSSSIRSKNPILTGMWSAAGQVMSITGDAQDTCRIAS